VTDPEFVFRHRDCHRADGSRKRQFGTKREAKLAARLTGRGVRAYKCRFCDQYHVGNQIARYQQAPPEDSSQ